MHAEDTTLPASSKCDKTSGSYLADARCARTECRDRSQSEVLPYANPARAPLFAENELNDFRRRWQDVQGSFVDDPRTAVRTADELVAQVMARLAAIFADERDKLEHEWDNGENVSTEDLRVALRSGAIVRSRPALNCLGCSARRPFVRSRSRSCSYW
jgi:hypothetical protein